MTMDQRKVDRIVALIGQLDGTPREWLRLETKIVKAITSAKGAAPVDWTNLDWQSEFGIDNRVMRFLLKNIGEHDSVFVTYGDFQVQLDIARHHWPTEKAKKRIQRLSAKLAELNEVPFSVQKDGTGDGFYFARKKI